MLARIAIVLLVGLFARPAVLHAQSGSPPIDFSEVYQQVVSSVVYIEVGNPMERTGSGSGFILHKDGYIATAAHVVEHADVIRVTFHDESACFARRLALGPRGIPPSQPICRGVSEC